MNFLVPEGLEASAWRMHGSKIGGLSVHMSQHELQRQSKANHKMWRQLEFLYSGEN